jgi:hypothetical protein
MLNLNVKSVVENALRTQEQPFVYEQGVNQTKTRGLLTPDKLFSKRNSLPQTEDVTKNDFVGLQTQFLTKFLASKHGIPLNTLWVVNIENSNDLKNNIYATLKEFENWHKYDDKSINISSLGGISPSMGLHIAQGVKIVGETIDVDRISTTLKSGYVQGLVGTGRTGFPALELSLLENNTSFIDGFLRPWTIAVSHKSLKDFSLKIDITVYILSKAGVLVPSIPRKIITYRNCCPIDIDTSEFNYTADNAPKLRPIKFVFSHYEVVEMNKHFDQLLDETIKIENFEKNVAEPTLVQNLINRGTNFAKDLAYGAAQRVVNNTIGSVYDKFTEKLIDIEQIIRSPVDNAVESVNDIVNNAVGKNYKNSGISLNSYNQKETDSNDSLAKRNINYVVKTGDSTVIKPINENDTPDHKTDVKIIKTNENDVPTHSTPVVLKTINPDDAPLLDKDLIKFKVVPNPPIDDARRGQLIKDDKKSDQNDYIDGKNILQQLLPNSNQNDYVEGKQLKMNDLPNPTNDAFEGKTVKFIFKTTNENDHTKYNT